MGLLGNLFGADKARMAATIERQRTAITKMVRGRYDAAQTKPLN